MVSKSNDNNNDNSEKIIIEFEKNWKAFEIIDCTCTIVSISSISRFACANVWSVCIITNSIYVTFARVCSAFVNICPKGGKKEKRMKNGSVYSFKSKESRRKKTCLQFSGFMWFSGWTSRLTRYFLNLFT